MHVFTPGSETLTMQPPLKQGANRPQDSGEVTVHVWTPPISGGIVRQSERFLFVVTIMAVKLAVNRSWSLFSHAALSTLSKHIHWKLSLCQSPIFLFTVIVALSPSCNLQDSRLDRNPLSPFFHICPPLSLLPSRYYLWLL